MSIVHHRARCLGDGAIRNAAQISSSIKKKISQPFNSRPDSRKMKFEKEKIMGWKSCRYLQATFFILCYVT